MSRLSPLFLLAIMGLFLISGAYAQMPPQSPEMPSEISPARSAADDVAPGGAPIEGSDNAAGVSNERDPFWPVGYVPRKVQNYKDKARGNVVTGVEIVPEPVKTPVWDEAGKKLDIRGISLIHERDSKTPKYLAMIAGKLVESGDVVSVRYDDRTYRWKVVGISEEGVSLQKIDVRGE